MNSAPKGESVSVIAAGVGGNAGDRAPNKGASSKEILLPSQEAQKSLFEGGGGLIAHQMRGLRNHH